MNDGLNKVMIIGYIDGVIELRHTDSGRPVTSFSVAAPRTQHSAEGTPYTAIEWFNVVAWGDLAKRCNQQISDKQNVYLEGMLQTRHWSGDSGETHSCIEIVARDVLLIG